MLGSLAACSAALALALSPALGFAPALPALPAAPAPPDGPDAALLDADARVVVHLDVRALLGGALGQALREHPDVGLDEALLDVQDAIGLDPAADVLWVTAYAVTAGDDDAFVALLRTTAALDGALARLATEPRHRTLEERGRVLRAFDEGGDTWYGWVGRAGEDARLLVVAGDRGRLHDAVDVVEGSRASLAGAAHPAVDLAASPGAFLLVTAADGPGALADLEPASNVARLVRGGLFEAGEHAGSLFARLSVDTRGPEEAHEVGAVVRGGLSLLRLAAGSGPDAAPVRGLLDGVQVRIEGPRVTVAARAELGALLEGLRALDAR